MITVLFIIGTRPEVIKMAPVITASARYPEQIRSVVCVTGQHRDMLDQALGVFRLRPDYDLDVMLSGQTLSELTSRLLVALDDVVGRERPDWILAQGDTTSVFAAALTAFYHRIPFGHVEAGLRTDDIARPYPEELNRRLTDIMARVWFAPTERARNVLLHEGCPAQDVVLTGNTVVDALHQVLGFPYDWGRGPLASLPSDKKLVLVTIHRRESFGEPLQEICTALCKVAESCAGEDIHFVFPVHPNPNVRGPVFSVLSEVSNISLLEPLDYQSLVQLLKRSILVLTDSGGLQEEAPSFGVPVMVMREKTERLEGVEMGIARLVGTDADIISSEVIRIIRNTDEYFKMVPTFNPYGDGKAASRIVSELMARSKN